MAHQVAIVTGANSGVGLALCERLLAAHSADRLRLCLACRNNERAQAAREELLSLHPCASIDVVLVDFSNTKSVRAAAAEIRARYVHIDFLFLNAGVMPNPSVDLKNGFFALFSRDLLSKLSTGDGLLCYRDEMTTEGLRLTFATNVLGHFVLVQELDCIMGGIAATQIIWTSSKNAKREEFDTHDIQHSKGHNPYASSKYLMDVVSVMLNERLNEKNIYSFVTCPGLVMTPLTYSILPSWLWTYFLVPLCKMLRVFIPSMTLDALSAAEALVWLTLREPQALDTRTKYLSSVSAFGTPFVTTVKLDFKSTDFEGLYQTLVALSSSLATGK